MTQQQYDLLEKKKTRIKTLLENSTITPEEALAKLQLLGFGFQKAVELVDNWGNGVYSKYVTWSKWKKELLDKSLLTFI